MKKKFVYESTPLLLQKFEKNTNNASKSRIIEKIGIDKTYETKI